MSTGGVPVETSILLAWGGKMLFTTKRLHF
jgi:hypothetical protein